MTFSSTHLRHRLLPIVLGQGVGLLCGIGGVKLTSHLVPPATFGLYGVFLTFASIGMWAVHAGLVKFVLRHWAATPSRPALLREVTRAAARKLPWLVFAAAIAVAIFARDSWTIFFPALVVASTLLAFAALAQAALQAAKDHWRDLAVSATASVTRSFVPPLFLLASSGSALALYTGFCAHALVFATAGAWALSRYWRRPTGDRPSYSTQLTSIYEGPAFIVLALANWALVGLNRWIFALAFGPVETGYFSLASNLATLVPTMLGSIVLQYFQPDLFAGVAGGRPDPHRSARRVDRIALGHALVALTGLGVLRFVAPWLIGPLIQETYRPALGLLLPAGCFMLAITTGQFFHSLLLAGQREKACVPVDLAAAVVLVSGGIVSAWLGGETWFLRWLLVTPAIPWLVNRPLARRYLFRDTA